MIDTHPCATPIPAQPVATVTSSEAPFPPAAPLPHAVAPAVTDPVSNLDFLPVDDAFALEMRSETIEQLAGGDALRRGESERIEAGRSQANSDLVAGRDRVRVHGSLHEHTGHGLAEQAAHLHVAVQRALLAGRLPPRFNASPLIAEARRFAEPELAHELAAGRLPLLTIDVLIDGYRANDEGGGNAPYIERLLSLKENIERALHDAYPGRVDPRWLDQTPALELTRRRGEPAAPSAASATVPAELDVVQWIERHLGTGGGASHPAPLPPPSAAGRIGAGAEAPPPAADPWRIRPPGMGGEPHPVAFDPRSAPPGPSSQVGYTRAIRTPVMSTGAPPRSQSAGTPGFARAASGAVELPFSRREEIAIRFGTEDALLHAELTVQLRGANTLGWSATRRRDVLHDLDWINAIAQLDSAAAAAGSDVDWRAIEALMRILDAPPPAP